MSKLGPGFFFHPKRPFKGPEELKGSGVFVLDNDTGGWLIFIYAKTVALR